MFEPRRMIVGVALAVGLWLTALPPAGLSHAEGETIGAVLLTLSLWATEYGLPTTWGISADQQAAFIHDFVVAWQQIDGAGPMFIHTTRDTATGAFGGENNFGIFTTNWTEKPAAATIAALIADLADGTVAPFDVTPYLPQNGFLQAVGIDREVALPA